MVRWFALFIRGWFGNCVIALLNKDEVAPITLTSCHFISSSLGSLSLSLEFQRLSDELGTSSV
jgi:hypothetical protein